jgi:hypothetical protein
MDFRLLGPLEVVDADDVVATDRLIGELWGEAPPATVAKSIQSYKRSRRLRACRSLRGAARPVCSVPGAG